MDEVGVVANIRGIPGAYAIRTIWKASWCVGQWTVSAKATLSFSSCRYLHKKGRLTYKGET